MAYSGENDKPELIGSITASKCDTIGNTYFRLKMNEVSYNTNYHFNLFVIVKQPVKRWELGGKYESIYIEKYGSKVKFDGRVMTSKEVI